MRGIARAGFFALAWSSLLTGYVAAQPANAGCTPSPSAAGTQTWRCNNGITIVAENGARFELKDANRDGHIDSVELSSKALLVEVPKKPGGNPFKVLTPQAIAAVRGTKWAVDVADAKNLGLRRRRPCRRQPQEPRTRRRSGPWRRRRCRGNRSIDRQDMGPAARRRADGKTGSIRPGRQSEEDCST
ncbi:hypothetical protein ACVIQS_004989 [Bradyrhizobium diazoefficiens]